MKLHLRRSLAIATSLALVGASGCSRSAGGGSGPSAVCASEPTLDQIKRIVFARAQNVAESPVRSAMPAIAKQSVVALKTPLLDSYDRDTRKTSCSATLHLHLPIGVLSPVRTPEDLTAAVRYSSQPLADGSGVHFELSDVNELVAGIAQADISRWAQQNAPRPSAPVPGRLVVVEATQSTTTTSAPTPRPAHAPVQTRPAAVAVVPATASVKPPTQAVPTARLATVQPARAAPIAPPAPAPAPAPARVARIGAVASSPSRPAVGQAAPATRRNPLNAPAAPPGAYADAETPLSPTRVFIHIADPEQMDEARDIGAQIRGLRLNGAPVGGMAIRLVRAVPRRPEVRCLKAADCAAARRLASWLGGVLPDGPPAVVDMHRAYQADPSVRAGTLELWLPPDPESQ